MKKLLLLPFVCVISVASAQTASAPFKGANVILIQTKDKPNDALRTFGTQLVAKGYTVKAMDSTFHTLITEPKNITGYVMPMAISVRVVGVESGLRVTAQNSISPNALTGVQTIVQPLSASGPKPRGPFVEIVQAAEAYPSGVVTYSKE